MFAELVKHFKMTVDQILELDWWTIRHVYFAPRDENGVLLSFAKHVPPRPRKPMALPEWYLDSIGYPRA